MNKPLIVISAILLVLIVFILLRRTPDISNSKDQKEIDSLNMTNITLNHNIHSRDSLIITLRNNDQKLKFQEVAIETVYTTKYEKINKMDANDLILQFNRIFADSSIK